MKIRPYSQWDGDLHLCVLNFYWHRKGWDWENCLGLVVFNFAVELLWGEGNHHE